MILISKVHVETQNNLAGCIQELVPFSTFTTLWANSVDDKLTLKAARKSASENVICLCRLLNILANFSNLFFAYQQTVWTLIRLLLKEQSDLGPHCLQK